MKKMKRLIIIIITALSIAALPGCKKYLATDPEDFLAPSTYYKDEAQLTAGLMGVYDVLGERSTASTYSRGLVTDLNFAIDEAYARTFSSSISPTYIMQVMQPLHYSTTVGPPCIRALTVLISYWKISMDQQRLRMSKTW